MSAAHRLYCKSWGPVSMSTTHWMPSWSLWLGVMGACELKTPVGKQRCALLPPTGGRLLRDTPGTDVTEVTIPQFAYHRSFAFHWGYGPHLGCWL
ncbi:hypothetical protein FKM82_014045 [Ascaphus truei]